MIRRARMAAFGGAILALAACSNADDASTEAVPETVELPAEEALASVTEEPVADDQAAGPVADETDETGASAPEPEPDTSPTSETTGEEAE